MASRNLWRGLHVVITAGPTREALDPVRYLTNASSGRMGYALAEAARRRGARVTLVSGPVSLPPPRGVKTVPVVSARDMLKASLRAAARADAFIAAAAVADWRPAAFSRRKIKKRPGRESLSLRLARNPDVLKTVSLRRRAARPALAGFALETNDLLRAARRKLAEKRLDVVVANPHTVLDRPSTRAFILHRTGKIERFGGGSKKSLAARVLDAVSEHLPAARSRP